MLNRRLPRVVCLLLCGLIGIVAVYQYRVTYDANRTINAFPEVQAIAHSIRHLGIFGNPFALLPTGPSAHLAPLFPAFLAALFRVFGEGATGAFVCEWSAAVTAALLVAILPWISWRLRIGFLTGLLASILWLVAKMKVYPYGEATYASVIVAVATCMFYKRLRLSLPVSWANGIPLGCVIGVLLLLIPTVGLVVAAWVLWLLRKDGLRPFRTFNLPLTVVPMLIVLPWLIRNYVVFDRVIPIRDDLGLELSVSNNDCAAYSIHKSEAIHCFDKLHPNLSIEEARKLAAMGEPPYNDLQFRKATLWIASHPRRFLGLSRERFIAFWFPNETGDPISEVFTRKAEPRIQRFIVYLTTILSAAGLWFLWAENRHAAGILALWLGIYPLIYYFVQFEDRYRYPIMWITFLLGAYALTVFARNTASFVFYAFRELMKLAR